MSYSQLTQEQRYVICVLNRRDETQKAIAEAVEVSEATISREGRFGGFSPERRPLWPYLSGPRRIPGTEFEDEPRTLHPFGRKNHEVQWRSKRARNLRQAWIWIEILRKTITVYAIQVTDFQ